MPFDSQDVLTNSYTFLYSWESVVKGFWLKYPNPKFPNVIFNKVIDMEIIDDTKLLIKRMMFSKYVWFWGHSIENITIDLKNRTLSMVTTITKRSKLSPNGKENCVYKAIEEEEGGREVEGRSKTEEEGVKRENEQEKEERREGGGRTLYTKELFSHVKIMKILGNLNHSFEKGCKIVEELSRSFENNKN